MSHRKRTAGSVRFDPYWKVQWWDRTSLAWRDIQRSHQTRAAAQEAAAAYWAENGEPPVRLMRITTEGRHAEPTKITRIPGQIARALRATTDHQHEETP